MTPMRTHDWLSAGVESFNPGPTTLMDNVCVCFCPVVSSLTWTVKVDPLASVGVPLMTPVWASNVSPFGNDPATVL